MSGCAATKRAAAKRWRVKNQLERDATVQRAEQFIRYLAETVDVWPEGMTAAVYAYGKGMRHFIWRKHYESLTASFWCVCTRKQWLTYKNGITLCASSSAH